MKLTKQIITKLELSDLEAARQLEQALSNLREDYPYRSMAQRAFGRLILGRLGLMPEKNITVLPRKAGGIVRVLYNKQARRLLAKAKPIDVKELSSGHD